MKDYTTKKAKLITSIAALYDDPAQGKNLLEGYILEVRNRAQKSEYPEYTLQQKVIRSLKGILRSHQQLYEKRNKAGVSHKVTTLEHDLEYRLDGYSPFIWTQGEGCSRAKSDDSERIDNY